MNYFTRKSLVLALIISLTPFFTESIYATGGFSACTAPCDLRDNPGSGGRAMILSRTYLEAHPMLSRQEERLVEERVLNLGKRRGGTGLKSATSVTITYDDFVAHFAPGQDRQVRFVSDETGIPMDVGGEGVEDLVWQMPDLDLYGTVLQRNITSESVASTPYLGDFPDASPTHAFDGDGKYEYFELFPDTDTETGALYYHGAADAAYIYLAGYVHAPVPMGLGLGVFGGEVDPVDCADIGGCGTGNPDEAYYQVFQEFEEVATGTLHTYDNDATQAIKVRNTERIIIVDVNDNILEEFFFDYLLWYSKDGHYLRCELADGADWEDNTSFISIAYQKIESALPVQWRSVIAEVKKDREVEDVEDLFWIMPDLSSFGPVPQITINAPAVASTPYLNDFPDASPTHVFDVNGLFEYYELIPETASDPGAVYFIGGADANNIYLGDFVHAPIPMALGLGVFGGEFDPVLCSLFDGGCGTGDPDEHSYRISQEFEEVGTGILQTYDDGSTEAIKVRNTIRVIVADINDVVLEEYETDYLIWYSKDGHYLRGELADDAPWTGNTSFTNIEYHKIATGALPVAWQELSAEVKKDREVEIRWATASETDNERFIVERSTDGTNFLPIGSQPAVGNNTGTENYLFLDEAAQEGFNYYRIKQVDFTGGSSYSTVVSALVTVSGEEALHILYPNPGRDEVYFSRPASYELFTAQGQRLANGQAEGSLDVTDLPAGPYLVRLDGGKLYRWVKQ